MTDWTDDIIRARFASLNTWRKAGVRAPHKPLMVLHALGRALEGRDRLVRFGDIERDVNGLIRDFGPPAARATAHYPFWHLQSDGIWELPARDAIVGDGLPRGREPRITVLRQSFGGFPHELHVRLVARPWLTIELVERLIAAHFPDSYREEIRARIGAPAGLFQARVLADQAARAVRFALARTRDPAFRDRVLRAWAGRCAVCGFDGRVGDRPFGVEAAHIKWHAAGGPDEPGNGLLLCTLHHRALDRGVLGLDADLRLKVSPAFSGSEAARAAILGFEGTRLVPANDADRPRAEFVAWHDAQVYRSTA